MNQNFCLNEERWQGQGYFPSWQALMHHLPQPQRQDAMLPMIYLADEGEQDRALNRQERDAIDWLLNHEAQLYRAVLSELWLEYHQLREYALTYLSDQQVAEQYPEYQDPSQLFHDIGIEAFYIHPLSFQGVPYLGVQCTCRWEPELGLGLCCYGTEVLSVGQSFEAFVRWQADDHLSQQMAEHCD
ncbi:hypothetical protein VST7929_00514 [Vibrio stylophorae]|uniref:DUF6985 domain-containing protein n=1 Tax=Vibrio stylophorae TaxID=659351 RepID=A0ABN8DQB2_9VIBR|nr:hypothetical protein [Vibrio stylophorae]CAH0532673.1 hypothetical protein VST7929_00514 [Vibrio stylophorae]